VVIKTKSQVGKIWEICPTIINLTLALNYHRHYYENMVNDYQLKSSILIDVDVLFVSGSTHQPNEPEKSFAIGHLNELF
jgi:hypothetical protein